jgi:hypothetical protein
MIQYLIATEFLTYIQKSVVLSTESVNFQFTQYIIVNKHDYSLFSSFGILKNFYNYSSHSSLELNTPFKLFIAFFQTLIKGPIGVSSFIESSAQCRLRTQSHQFVTSNFNKGMNFFCVTSLVY